MPNDSDNMSVFNNIRQAADRMGKGSSEPVATTPAPPAPGPGQMSLTLARALSYKKRVAERLKQVETDITTNNSVVSGQEREVDIPALSEERNKLVNHMINLKVAIQNANGPIQRAILDLAEMKSENEFYRRVPTLNGVRQNQYAYDPGQSTTITYSAVIRKSDVDELVKRTNARIDQTQEKIEAHNHSIYVTIEDIGLLS